MYVLVHFRNLALLCFHTLLSLLARHPPAPSLPQILLDASSIQLGDLPLGVYAPSPSQASWGHTIYEVCVCPSGKVYLSPAESSSTCQTMSNICLWS